jgi:hypothetical protein
MDNNDVFAFPDTMVNDSNYVQNVNSPKSPRMVRKQKIDSENVTSPSLQKFPRMLRKDRVDSDKMGNVALNTWKSPRKLRKERVNGEENLSVPKMVANSTDTSKQVVDEMSSIPPDNLFEDMERMGTVPKMAANSTDASKQVVAEMRIIPPDNLLDDMECTGTEYATIAADIHQFDHDNWLKDMECTATESATIVAEKDQGPPSLVVCPSTLKFPPLSNAAPASVQLASGSTWKHVGKAQRPKCATKQSGRVTTSPVRKHGATTVNDELIGKLVAFYLDSTVGKDIVTSFESSGALTLYAMMTISNMVM